MQYKILSLHKEKKKKKSHLLSEAKHCGWCHAHVRASRTRRRNWKAAHVPRGRAGTYLSTLTSNRATTVPSRPLFRLTSPPPYRYMRANLKVRSNGRISRRVAGFGSYLICRTRLAKKKNMFSSGMNNDD